MPVPEGLPSPYADLVALLSRQIAQVNALELGQVTRGAVLRRTSNFTPPTSSFASLPFEVADIDTGGFWNSGQPTRITIAVPGIYVLSYVHISLTINNAVQIVRNNTTVEFRNGPPSTGIGSDTTTVLYAAPPDYFEVRLLDSAGDVIVPDGTFPRLTIGRI